MPARSAHGLAKHDRADFAQEFLRRNPGYRADWAASRDARRWGLVSLFDPDRPVRSTPALWRADSASQIVTLVPAPADFPAAASLAGDGALNEMWAADVRHLVIERAGLRHRIQVRGRDPHAPLAILLAPLGDTLHAAACDATPSRLTAGAINRGDRWIGVDLLPEQRRHSVFASFSQDIFSGLRFYARGQATWRNFSIAVQSSGDARRTVPVANPFYVDPLGTRQPVGVMYSFTRDLGPERTAGRVTAYGGTAGLEAQFGAWRIDGHGTWGRQVEHYGLFNRINTARLALALADTNPATAYNLFGDGPSTNPATIESIRGYTLRDYGGWSWSAAIRADGPLFALPAGTTRLAVGAEFRKDRYKDIGTRTYTSTLTPVPLAVTPYPGARTVKSAYAELLLPVFGEGMRLPGFYKLDISAAIRAERYSDFGDTHNPKLSLAWETVRGLTLRATFGKSFRAPIFPELRQDPASMAYYAWSAPDPQSLTGSSNMLVIAGNDPDLHPERATTWTVGADLKPQFLPGFQAGVTWFKVDYTDRIATPRPNLGNFLINRDVYDAILTPNPSAPQIAEFYASPYFLDLTGIPKTATFVAIADARLQNLSSVRQSGLDVNLSYAFDLAGGRTEFGGSATYIFYIKQALTETAPSIDVINTIGNPIDLRARAHVSWSNGGFSATLFGNYVAAYTNKTVSPFEPVSAWTTFDLNLSYAFTDKSGPFSGLRVALTGNNIFNREPPYVNYTAGTYTAAFDAENANPLGRFVALQVTKKW
ncbi:TonB-dependent receptor domain-containing protein [Sphingomonas canadensis]|uniref:TonB-dependent receptor domain-containing protein n=1 Tax=Sphingomonas canadensis TaxID=1219257 RepID=A0ABW3HCE3_9SPHN|nr:TonB-dependent receptor [Sphingomonas canadensis]